MRLFQESIDQDMAEPLNFVFNNLSLPLMELADGLLERTEKLGIKNKRLAAGWDHDYLLRVIMAAKV